MARNKVETINPAVLLTKDDEVELSNKFDDLKIIDKEEAERIANAKAIAAHFGYTGSIEEDALIEQLKAAARMYLEGRLRMGITFSVLKGRVPRGRFIEIVEQFGFSARVAQYHMRVSERFPIHKFRWLIDSLETFAQLKELAALDDEALDSLEDGEEVAGLHKDTVSKMTKAELHAKVNEYKERLEAKDKLIQQKNATIDRITEDNAKMENKLMLQTPEEQMLAQRDRFQRHAMTIKAHIMTDFRRELKELYEQEGDHRDFAAACFIEIFKELQILRDEYNLERVIREDGMPEWLTPEGLAEIEAMGAEG